jgi:hypothetical protein
VTIASVLNTLLNNTPFSDGALYILIWIEYAGSTTLLAWEKLVMQRITDNVNAGVTTDSSRSAEVRWHADTWVKLRSKPCSFDYCRSETHYLNLVPRLRKTDQKVNIIHNHERSKRLAKSQTTIYILPCWDFTRRRDDSGTSLPLTSQSHLWVKWRSTRHSSSRSRRQECNFSTLW